MSWKVNLNQKIVSSIDLIESNCLDSQESIYHFLVIKFWKEVIDILGYPETLSKYEPSECKSFFKRLDVNNIQVYNSGKIQMQLNYKSKMAPWHFYRISNSLILIDRICLIMENNSTTNILTQKSISALHINFVVQVKQWFFKWWYAWNRVLKIHSCG